VAAALFSAANPAAPVHLPSRRFCLNFFQPP
jgi:hypothetical protein